jgi:S-adenosyl-L-methionine hydrolase (adenosine-forming)
MIITLTTDFGLADPFVGMMKGVMLGIAPNAQLVDLTHEIHSYDILEAALIIEGTYRYFPAGTVHIIVVDPGVGSERRPMAAMANGHIFVAPDNGVLSLVLQTDAVASLSPAYEITNGSLFQGPVSHTFHGRDIFAPVAAHLVRGTPIESVGPRIVDFVKRPFPAPRPQGDRLVGTVLRIDKFGNIITNFRLKDLGDDFSIRVAGLSITRLCRSFSEADPGEFVAIDGSAGFIELALNQGSAADRLKVERGAEIELETGSVNL